MSGKARKAAAANLFVVLCGTPASGKTTFARFLLSQVCSDLTERVFTILPEELCPHKPVGITVHHICYDEVYKNFATEDTKAFSPRYWRKSREYAQNQIEFLCERARVNPRALYCSETLKTASYMELGIMEKNPIMTKLFVIDDTNHMKGMRKKLMRIAGRYDAGIVFLHFWTSERVSKKRNSLRDVGEIPDSVLEASFDTFDECQGTEGRCWIEFNTETESVDQCFERFLSPETRVYMHPPEIYYTHERSPNTADNVMNLLDLKLREIVSDKMTSLQDFSPVETRRMAKMLHRLKKEFSQRNKDVLKEDIPLLCDDFTRLLDII